jgi:hypothetical protein
MEKRYNSLSNNLSKIGDRIKNSNFLNINYLKTEPQK